MDSHRIDDLHIQLSLANLDEVGRTLARTRLDVLRPDTGLPAQAITQFDWADISALEDNGQLFSVMQHELLRGLGFGTLWAERGLVDLSRGEYVGIQAVQAFQDLGGLTNGIPLAGNAFGPPGLHWNEALFRDELMTANLGYQTNANGQVVSPISPITLASLADLGYGVDSTQATPGYRLMGGQLAPRSEWTPAQWAAVDQLAQDIRLIQAPLNASTPNSTTLAWAHGEGDATQLQDYLGAANLLWRDITTGQTSLWLMEEGQYISSVMLPTVPPNWEIAGIADFTRDGHQDLLWHDSTTGQLAVWAMDGASAVSGLILSSEPDRNWQIAGAADFTGDGNPDILWRNQQTGETRLWNLYAGVQLPMYDLIPFPTVPPQWEIKGVGDFNHDGDPDLLWRDQLTGHNAFWILNGTTPAFGVNLPFLSASWEIAGVGDLNQDGHLDILWRNSLTGNNQVWLMEGTRFSTELALPPVTSLNWHLEGAMPMAFPTPTQLALLPSSDSGVLGDAITNDATPTLTGNATPGTWVKLYEGNTFLGQGLTGQDGIWQVTTRPLSDRWHDLTAKATDATGLASLASAPFTLTIDTFPPTLSLTSIAANDSLNHGARLIGYVENFSADQPSLQYHWGDGPAIPIPLAADGRFNQALDWGGITNGSQTLTLVATDLAGNVRTTTVTVTVALTPQVTLELAQDTGNGDTATRSDGITRIPGIRGNILAGEPIVQLRAQLQRPEAETSDLPAEAMVDITTALNPADRTFSLNALKLATLYGKPVTDGTYTLQLQAKDRDGTWSEPGTLTFTLDRVPPSRPTGLTLVNASSTSTGGVSLSLTNTPTVTGQAEPGTWVTIWIDGQSSEQTIPVAEDGTWQVQLSSLADGLHSISAKALDAAGNESAASQPLPIRVLTQASAQPTLQLAPSSDTGLSDHDGITTATRLVLTGTALPGATVEVRMRDSMPTATITADANGLWEAIVDQPAGTTRQWLAKATHPTTPASLTSPPLTITVDTQPASAASIDRFSPDTDSGSSQHDRITQTDTPVIQGFAERGAQVQVFDETGQLVGQTIAHDGTWQITPTALDAGIHYLKAVSMDIAGNLGTASSAFEFAITEKDSLWQQGNGYTSGPYEEVWSEIDPDELKAPGQTPTAPPLEDPAPGTGNPGAELPGLRPATPDDVARNNSLFWGSWHGKWDLYGQNYFTDAGRGTPYPYGRIPSQISQNSHDGKPLFWDLYMAAYYDSYYPNQEPPLDPDGNPYTAPPDDNTPPLSPSPPLPTFLEKLQIMLDGLIPRLNPASQPVFEQQEPLLMAMGKVIDERELYDLPGMFDLYDHADDATTRHDAESGVSGVAEKIRTAKQSTLEAILETKLNLALATATTVDMEDLEKPLAELTKTYAKLRQRIQTDIPLDQHPSAFEVLWQAEDGLGLTKGLEAFEDAFESIKQPEQTIAFLNNLLAAVQQVPGLQAELQDAAFLDALMQFGLTVAQLNLAPTAGPEPLWSFLDTLWQGSSPGDIRLGAQQLAEFFKDATTPEKRLKLLQFSDHLLQAATLAPTTQPQVKDPHFVDALLGLGSAYASLEPATNSMGQDQDLNFFLDTLYDAKNIEKGSQELGVFLGDFVSSTDQLDMLKFEQKLLKTFGQVPALKNELNQPRAINEMFNLGISYAVLESALDVDCMDLNGIYSNAWFAYVWNAENLQEFTNAANYLEDFIASANTYASSSSNLEAPSSPTQVVMEQFSPTLIAGGLPFPPAAPAWMIPWLTIPGLPTSTPLPTDPGEADWQHQINPMTTKPYQSENEYIIVKLGTPKQVEELYRTAVTKSFIPRLGREPNACIMGDIPRLGGNRRHNAYAKHITGVDTDVYILTTEGKGITYDGRPEGTQRVWEVKAPKKDEKGTWLNQAESNPSSYWGERAVSAIGYLTAQMYKQRDVARDCGFDYKYATASEGLTNYLNRLWRGQGGPRVEYIKYPNKSYLTNESDEVEYFPNLP